eukprot:6199112-Pleurochrysis_carterae.AAC.4
MTGHALSASYALGGGVAPRHPRLKSSQHALLHYLVAVLVQMQQVVGEVGLVQRVVKVHRHDWNAVDVCQ